MTYVAAGLKGNNAIWKKLLEKIEFTKKDFMFVVGPFSGNPDETFEFLEDLSYAENIYPVSTAGDRLVYEMLDGFEKMLKSGAAPDAEYVAKMQKWAAEGGREILDAFRGLDAEMKEGILDYLADMPDEECITAGKKDLTLTENGLSDEDGNKVDCPAFGEKICAYRIEDKKAFYID